MAFEKREGQGTLFYNEGATGKQPHLKGYVIINQVEYEIACWPGREGSKAAYSLKAEVKQERRDGKPMGIGQQAAERVRRPDPISSGRPLSKGEFDERNARVARDDMDDAIPF